MSTVGQQPLRWSHRSDVASFGLGPPFRLNTHAHTRAYAHAHAHTQHAYLMPELWHICAALNLLPFDSEAGALIKPSQIRLFKLTSPILARGTPPVPPPALSAPGSHWASDQFKPPFEADSQNVKSCPYPEIVVSVSWMRGMDTSKLLSCRLCSGLALHGKSKQPNSEFTSRKFKKCFGLTCFQIESTFSHGLRTEACRCSRTAELCRKSQQSDTRRVQKKQNE